MKCDRWVRPTTDDACTIGATYSNTQPTWSAARVHNRWRHCANRPFARCHKVVVIDDDIRVGGWHIKVTHLVVEHETSAGHEV